MDIPLTRKVKELSGGQKARLLLAYALITNPDVLLLDEPTNHINFRHIPVITKAINEFEGAIIFVSHLPEFFEKIKEVRVVDCLGLYTFRTVNQLNERTVQWSLNEGF